MNPTFEEFLSQELRAQMYMAPAKDTAALWRRWERSADLVSHVLVLEGGDPNVASVRSFGSERWYNVSLSPLRCDCPDQGTRAPWGWCKHALALWRYRRMDRIRRMEAAWIERQEQAIAELQEERDRLRRRVHELEALVLSSDTGAPAPWEV